MKKNIEEAYVSFGVAKLLREKKFDEQVDSAYIPAVMHKGNKLVGFSKSGVRKSYEGACEAAIIYYWNII